MSQFNKLKYIRSVGAEFEGGICNEKYEKFLDTLAVFLPKLYRRIDVGSDGSVRAPVDGCMESSWRNAEIRVWSENPEDLIAFARLLWKFGFRQNETCGNHMHIRFKNILYASVFTLYDAVEQFINAYKNKFTAYKYRVRLGGRYSRAQETQAHVFSNFLGDRYYAINLYATTKPTRTLEIRIMPYADSAEEWAEMLRFNIETVEAIVDKFISRFAYEFDVATIARDVINSIQVSKISFDRIDRVYDVELVNMEPPTQYDDPPYDPPQDYSDYDNEEEEYMDESWDDNG
jgi:hypothetical protein